MLLCRASCDVQTVPACALGVAGSSLRIATIASGRALTETVSWSSVRFIFATTGSVSVASGQWARRLEYRRRWLVAPVSVSAAVVLF